MVGHAWLVTALNPKSITFFVAFLPQFLSRDADFLTQMIVFEATLSFLGMGVQPPTPSWGGIMLDGKNYITSAWWVASLPGLAIVVTSLALVLIGDGLQARTEAMRAREGDR